jgi:hypothetical protein
LSPEFPPTRPVALGTAWKKRSVDHAAACLAWEDLAMARIYGQNPTKIDRNKLIWTAYAIGTPVASIASAHGLSEARVYEVIHQVAATIPEETRDQIAKMRRSSIDLMRERVAEIMSQPPKRMYAPNGKQLPELDYSEILQAIDRGIKLDERLARLSGTDAPARSQTELVYAEQEAGIRRTADYIRALAGGAA